MATADEDSGLRLVFGSWSGTAGAATAPDLPVLDLTSDGPLPLDLSRPTSGPRASATPARATWKPAPGGEPVDRGRRAGGSIFLSGDVLMCACPTCGAPMSIRLWLMVADCWQCGTSIELTEEQERQARRLLRERQQQRSRNQTAPAVATPTTHPSPPESRQRPSPPPPRPKQPPAPPSPRKKTPQHRVAAARKPVGARARIRRMATVGTVRVWIHDLVRNMPAWLISLVFHMILLTVLGLLTIDRPRHEPFIVLSAEISAHRREGGNTDAADPEADVKFELPIPEPDKTRDKQYRQALVRADQDARQIRLNPDSPLPELPEVRRVKQRIGTGDARQRMLAARDPRVRVEMVKREGGTTFTEAAVARALRWMALQQNPDGGWNLQGRGRSDAAGTSLALLPFLGAGQTHRVGRYRDEVSAGLRWLLKHQGDDGDLRAGTSSNHGMYAHGQATIVLCEAYAMTGDETFHRAAQKAVDFIAAAQHVDGGWRYRPGEAGDTSVLGWQLMALESAKAAGLDVPDATMESAGHYLDSVQSRGGSRYAYQRQRPPTEVMTAEALLCRMYLGWTRQDPGLDRGIDFLSDEHSPRAGQNNFYYWYYGTQVLHHAGGDRWERWNLRMRDVLVNSQQTSGATAGSWTPRGNFDRSGGRLYTTSLAACTLEVYYRHLPLFRRIRLDQ